VSDDAKTHKAESRSPEHASASRLTTPSLNEVATKVIGHLRRMGNDALAERFLAALARWHETSDAFVQHCGQGTGHADDQDAMHQALEELQRVLADVGAWFDSQAKGGA
jgi:uncharacterized protein YukE